MSQQGLWICDDGFGEGLFPKVVKSGNVPSVPAFTVLTSSAAELMRMLRLAKLGTLSVIWAAFSLAYPGKPFSLQVLVEEADVIAIVDISEIDDVRPIAVNIDGRDTLADTYRAKVRLARCIKGECPGDFILEFFTPRQFVGYPGVATGRQMIFVKPKGETYEFADRHFPSLPAALESVSVVETEPLQRVIAELGRVMSSRTVAQAQKWTVLARARGIPNSESFTLSLQVGLDAAETLDLRYRIQAELVSRDDPSALGSAVDLLLSNDLADEQRLRFLLAIANDVRNPKSVPKVSRLLHSGSILSRRAAAEALWHIADSQAIPDLVRGLQDSDDEVRFYSVRALSDIANDPSWGGPGESEFQEHQHEYLTHWQNWARSRAQSQETRP